MRQYRYGRGKGRGQGGREQQERALRGRPLKEIELEEKPKIEELLPHPRLVDEETILTLAEYEAMRLVDLEGYDQEEAGEMMKVSRGTIWRLLESGRRKMMETITRGKKLIIEKTEGK